VTEIGEGSQNDWEIARDTFQPTQYYSHMDDKVKDKLDLQRKHLSCGSMLADSKLSHTHNI
jgi:hypothetical protein